MAGWREEDELAYRDMFGLAPVSEPEVVPFDPADQAPPQEGVIWDESDMDRFKARGNPLIEPDWENPTGPYDAGQEPPSAAELQDKAVNFPSAVGELGDRLGGIVGGAGEAVGDVAGGVAGGARRAMDAYDNATPQEKARLSESISAGLGSRVSGSTDVGETKARMMRKEGGPIRPDADVVAGRVAELDAGASAADIKAKEALEAEEETARKFNKINEGYLNEKAELERNHAAGMKKADDAARERAMEREGKLNAMYEEIQSGKVDPDRIWNESGVLGRTSHVMAAFIGGFLAPTLGRNDIQGVIDKTIARDIDAQKHEADKKIKQFGMLKGMDERALKLDETASDNREEQHILRLGSLSASMKAEAAGLQDEVEKNKRLKLAAEIDRRAADRTSKLAQDTYKTELDTNVRAHNAKMAEQNIVLETKKVRIAASRAATARRAQKYKESQDRAKAAAAVQSAMAGGAIPKRTTGIVGPDGQNYNVAHLPEWRQKEIFKMIPDIAGKQDSYNKAEVMKKMLAGRVKVPGAEITAREAAAASKLLLSGNFKISRSTEKDMEVIRAAQGGDVAALARLSSDGTIIRVLEDFQAQTMAEGRNLAGQIGDDVEFVPRMDKKLQASFADEMGLDPRAAGPSGLLEGVRNQPTVEKTADAALDMAAGMERYEIRPGDKKVEEAINILANIPEEKRKRIVGEGGTLNEVDPLRKLEELYQKGSDRYAKRQVDQEKKKSFAKKAKSRRKSIGQAARKTAGTLAGPKD